MTKPPSIPFNETLLAVPSVEVAVGRIRSEEGRLLVVYPFIRHTTIVIDARLADHLKGVKELVQLYEQRAGDREWLVNFAIRNHTERYVVAAGPLLFFQRFACVWREEYGPLPSPTDARPDVPRIAA